MRAPSLHSLVATYFVLDGKLQVLLYLRGTVNGLLHNSLQHVESFGLPRCLSKRWAQLLNHAVGLDGCFLCDIVASGRGYECHGSREVRPLRG